MKVMVQGTQGQSLRSLDKHQGANHWICSLIEVNTSPEQVHALVQATLQEDLLFDLSKSIHLLPFEARKDTQTIFSHILRFRPVSYASDKDPPVISYLVHHRPEIIVELCRGYMQSQSAMPCGVILREALKFDVITAIVLYDQSSEGESAIRLSEVKSNLPQRGDGVFWRFFDWIDKSNFEVSADAFTTFRVGLLSEYHDNTS
jgi:calcium binding protein 39